MSTTSAPAYSGIAIVGGGLGGLALLLTLSRRGVPATLYERDTDAASRARLGGSLDLGYESGQRALRENGLETAFKKYSREEGDAMKICDAAGTVVFDDSHFGPRTSDTHRPEIDRADLRQILVDACPAASIQWGHSLLEVRPLDDGTGRHELVFADGARAVHDYIVGADGAHSRVRPLVSAAVPEFTGVNGAEFYLTAETMALPALAAARAFVGEGTVNALQAGRMFALQANGRGRMRVYAWFRGPEAWTLPHEPAAARAAIREMYAGWAGPLFLDVLEHADEQTMFHRPLYRLPIGHTWEHRAGVTLVGDAAHMMSPFAGAGANLALLDGLELGLVLVEELGKGASGDVEGAVKKLEEKMLAMAGRVAKKTQENLEAFIHDNAPQSVVERFKVMMAGPPREG
ncbi:FAD/NAD-P-binding domain-containing protein [Epithele typhae]|uniref:FAD/NAD-P-binding domain-containing protein n=1 Tax=Epithele typhae TaxID=378194 RepID=UPI002008B15E|nr:FAD/NAD-P-binding domain-containing protein [Epithele typhae]KAH9939106.1 FAD/NAD-P-binding domain-containing protein [Epithele typhae]